jgi:hypothetical protein
MEEIETLARPTAASDPVEFGLAHDMKLCRRERIAAIHSYVHAEPFPAEHIRVGLCGAV